MGNRTWDINYCSINRHKPKAGYVCEELISSFSLIFSSELSPQSQHPSVAWGCHVLVLPPHDVLWDSMIPYGHQAPLWRPPQSPLCTSLPVLTVLLTCNIEPPFVERELRLEDGKWVGPYFLILEDSLLSSPSETLKRQEVAIKLSYALICQSRVSLVYDLPS